MSMFNSPGPTSASYVYALVFWLKLVLYSAEVLFSLLLRFSSVSVYYKYCIVLNIAYIPVKNINLYI